MENIKVFMLESGLVLIGKFDLQNKKFSDVLQIGVKKMVEKSTNKTFTMPVCVPIGSPLNGKPQIIDLNNFRYLFEIEDENGVYNKAYEEDLFDIQNPHIIKTETNKIIS